MDKLGIEPSLLLAQVVNFAIIVFVLQKLLYKPVLEMLEKRKKKIEEGLAYTAQMQGEMEKLDQKKAKVLEAAKKEANEIVAEARKTAKDEEKRILAEAHEAAEAIIAKGRAETEHQKEEMMKDVRKESVDLAVSMARRLLSGVMNAETQHTVLKKHIHEIESL